MKTFIGIDLGSTTTKAIVIDGDQTVLGRGITNSRSNYGIAAEVAKQEALLDGRFFLLRREVRKLPALKRRVNAFSSNFEQDFRLQQYLEQLGDLEQDGFMFGVKLSLNKRFLGVTSNFELFQSIDKCSRGCLDEKGEWIENGVFYRRTFTLGRLKWYASRGIIRDRTIVTSEIGNSDQNR